MSTAAGGFPSPRRQRPYTMESLRRELRRHEAAGLVVSWEAPGGPSGSPRWRIEPFGLGVTLELVSTGCYAFLCGLAAGHAAALQARIPSRSGDVDTAGAARGGP